MSKVVYSKKGGLNHPMLQLKMMCRHLDIEYRLSSVHDNKGDLTIYWKDYDKKDADIIERIWDGFGQLKTNITHYERTWQKIGE